MSDMKEDHIYCQIEAKQRFGKDENQEYKDLVAKWSLQVDEKKFDKNCQQYIKKFVFVKFNLKEKNWKMKFDVENVNHELKVNDIKDNLVTITISSDPITFDLLVNETKKINLDN